MCFYQIPMMHSSMYVRTTCTDRHLLHCEAANVFATSTLPARPWSPIQFNVKRVIDTIASSDNSSSSCCTNTCGYSTIPSCTQHTLHVLCFRSDTLQGYLQCLGTPQESIQAQASKTRWVGTREAKGLLARTCAGDFFVAHRRCRTPSTNYPPPRPTTGREGGLVP